MKSQFVTSSGAARRGVGSAHWGGIRRATPYAFTEQGVAMLSSVLKSKQAVQVNIQIMRAFVRLGKFLLAHKELATKLQQLEAKYGKHDEQIKIIFKAIKRLFQPPEKPKRQIGFRVEEPIASYRTKARKRQ